MSKNEKNEDRAVRFKRVAERRTDAVLNALRLLGNCSNKSAYQYNEQDITKIFRVIEEQLRTTKVKFKRVRPTKFTLS
jgi:hypothetical protein